MSHSLAAHSLADRCALVTGASSGIGREVARRLASLGARVVACARRYDRLAELAAESEGSIHPARCDLRDLSEIEALFSEVRAEHGGVDILVNNAGFGHKQPLMSGEPAVWRDMLAVNVLALSACTRHAVVDMQARGVAGHILHISSLSAHRVPGGSGMYSATKFAVRSVTEGLRQELRDAGSPIRVTSISPGFVETEFAENYHGDPDAAAATYRRYPVLQPRDIADAVEFTVTAPAHVEYHDLLVRPTQQSS